MNHKDIGSLMARHEIPQMKQTCVIVLLLLCSMVGLIHAQRSPSFSSPQLNADKTVTFRLSALKAEKVLLKGYELISSLNSNQKDFAFNGIPMAKNIKGVWSVTIGPLESNYYFYKFEVDGVSVLDPLNETVYDGSDDLLNVLIVPGKDGGAFWESKSVPHGTVHRQCYHSQMTKTTNDVYVYTPPGYEMEKRKYPVLYLLHGRGMNAHAWLSGGLINNMADNLLAENKIEPMIIVMPTCIILPSTPTSKTVLDELSTNLEQELFHIVIPMIESTYRTYSGREYNAIAGFSLGGALTDKIGLHHLEKFSSFGIMSAGLFDFASEHKDLLDNPGTANNKIKFLLLAAGSKDVHGPGGSSVAGLKALDSLLNRKSIRHTFYEMPNAEHTWNAWRYDLNYKFLPFLWKQ
jgi:enterochelin esterase-like enzyme